MGTSEIGVAHLRFLYYSFVIPTGRKGPVMDIDRITAILDDSFGEVGEGRQPAEGCELVRLFVVAVVLRTDKVRQHAAEMIELLKEWPSESWGQPVPPLGEEISYLTAGGVLGDQDRALRLFAFGKVLGWWEIRDPHTVLGVEYDDPHGRELAGMGMVYILGYQPGTA